MQLRRASGILMHLTSLPGKFGIGSLGRNARDFLDFLAAAGQCYWQILPTGPTGYGDSPYQTFSAFAGNPLLIDFEELVTQGWLLPEDLQNQPEFPADHIPYGEVINFRFSILYKAFARFQPDRDFTDFLQKNSYWLTDFSLFMALKHHFQGQPWQSWPQEYRKRDKESLQEIAMELSAEIRYQQFLQYLFFRQWSALLAYAHSRKISIIGDIPIFVAMDSADAWAHPRIFLFDEECHPLSIAGVPPDFFSETGQLWGNPLYNWEQLAKTEYQWWIDRFRITFQLFDLVRVDHFRGFAGYWAVPYGEKTAEKGEWISAPGRDLFDKLKAEFGELPVIAEDLGVITEDVVALRDEFGFPGMKILQFAFGSDENNPFLPHLYSENCVVYTGTHDNDTIRGWFSKIAAQEKRTALDYLESDGSDICWDLISAAWRSKAVLAVTTMQDLLCLDSSARMNTPATPGGNWQWRCPAGAWSQELIQKLRKLTKMCGR